MNRIALLLGVVFTIGATVFVMNILKNDTEDATKSFDDVVKSTGGIYNSSKKHRSDKRIMQNVEVKIQDSAGKEVSYTTSDNLVDSNGEKTNDRVRYVKTIKGAGHNINITLDSGANDSLEKSNSAWNNDFDEDFKNFERLQENF